MQTSFMTLSRTIIVTDEMLTDADVNQLSLILKESHHYDFVTFILACGGL